MRAGIVHLVIALLMASSALANDDTDKPRRKVRIGGIMVGAGYSHWSGGYPYGAYPYWFPYYRFPWTYGGFYSPLYDPFLFGPYFHPGYFRGFAWQPNLGAVKLRGGDKDALVYLDGALAGSVGKLKNMWLGPGAYSLEVKSTGREYRQRIYVLSGKTLELDAGKLEVRQ